MFTQTQLAKIREQLIFTKDLIEKLSPYYQREIRQLPEDLISEIKKIKIGPRVTSSGLEKTSNIILGLYIAQKNFEEILENPELYANRYFKKTLVKPAEAQKPSPKSVIQPAKKPLKPVSKPQPEIKIPIKIKPVIQPEKPTTAPSAPAEAPKIKIQIKPVTPKPASTPPTPSSTTPPGASKIEL